MAENRSWLVMLYLAGDNDLSEEMVLALQDLQAQGPPPGAKIVAQFDPSGVGLRSQRYDFSNAGPTSTKTRLDDYSVPFPALETNTGSPKTLQDFVEWARKLHGKDGADDRQELLILSGHGSGTTEDFLMKDEAAMDSLTIQELKGVLKEIGAVKKIDILGMDACFMAMGEVAYELRDEVGVLVGAEGMEPSFGWPYSRIAKMARAAVSASGGEHMSPKALATLIVDAYADHYADY